MLQTTQAFIIIGTVVIAFLAMLLAPSRRPQTGPRPLPGGEAWGDGSYPPGYWMTIGIAAGIALGLGLGVVVRSLVGGMSIDLGVGLMLGKLLAQRYDKVERQFTEEQKQECRHHATWDLVAMVVLVLATQIAALLSLLD